jgi:hypothetical protein
LKIMRTPGGDISASHEKRGRAGRRRRLKGERGRGTLAKE